MKILLIDPPFYRFIKYFNRFFPLGLTSLASELRSKGHDVIIYDADANVDKNVEMDFSILESKYPEYINCINNLSHPVWDEARSVIKQIKPEVVGISVFTTKVAAAFRTAQIVKEIDERIHVVIGGPHPSVKAKESLKISPFVDFAIRGEGEISFPLLVEAIEGKKPYHDVKGLSYKENDRICHNPPAEFISDLDEIPLPARDLLFHKDSYTSEDMGMIMTGRGCPFECTFCSSSGVWCRKARFRSVPNVVSEIIKVKEKYGTHQFAFKDDTFTLNRKRVDEFCCLIEEKRLKINWECNVRANLIDEISLIKMKSAGCNSVKLGVESGSDRILSEVMKKGITVEQIIHASELLHKVGIHWTGYFMMGLPGETKQEILKTLCLMKKIKPDFASLSVYEPFPETELYDKGNAMGYVTDTRSLKDYYTISPKYYYVKDIANRIDTMSDEEFRLIEESMKVSFHKYNCGPGRILKRVSSRSALYLRNPKALLGDMKKFMAWLS